MEYAYLTGLAGLIYTVWKTFPPRGSPELSESPKTCPGKPLITLYYNDQSELCQRFLPRWEAQKKLYVKLLDFMEVRVDPTRDLGAPPPVPWVPEVPWVKIDVGSLVLTGENLAEFETFFKVFDLPTEEPTKEETPNPTVPE